MMGYHVRLLESLGHTLYIEPFSAGSGSVGLSGLHVSTEIIEGANKRSVGGGASAGAYWATR